MCKFFSCVSDGAGNIMYFDSEIRKQIIDGTLKDSRGDYICETDSHSSILAFNGFFGTDEDMFNKYEYNPLTKEFEIDRMNNKDDSKVVKQKCLELDFKTIVPELIIKPIIHPFKDIVAGEVTGKEIELLKQWASVMASVCDSVRASVMASVRDSVRASVWDSVRDSVRASVRDSVRASVWDSVRDSVRDSVWDSVWDSVRASVWDSVWASVRASVWASVWAYFSSFFNLPKWEYIEHEKGKNPFQPCIDLWESGFVPSFDGKVWRLHTGKGAKVVYEWHRGEVI